jgi:hypothetical protein
VILRAAVLFAVLAACGARTRGPEEWKPEPPAGLERGAQLLWRKALGADARSGSLAVLVSRRVFSTLAPVRSWQASPALEAYVRWADRPEPARWEKGWLTADTGPHDLILVRWPAARVRASVPVRTDPVGFAVLDAGAPGPKRLRVELLPAPDPPEWLSHLRLDPEARIAGVAGRGQGIAEIYGENLGGGSVTDGSRPLKVLYQSDSQVNVQLDGARRVCIEASCAEVGR